MMTRIRALVVAGLLSLLASSLAGTEAQRGLRITTPREQFDAHIGDDYFLATFTQLEAYWKKLDRESDRLALVNIGRTEEGRAQWMAVVSAPKNLQKLDRYKDISRRLARAEGLTDDQARALAQEGKAVVWISGGLHANEVLGAQQLIEIVYQLVSRGDAETQRILRDVIVLAVHANPDGHDLVAEWYMREPDPLKRTLAGLPRLFQKYVGHDNNRDFYMATQAETINMNRVLYQEWLPQIVYDHHQFAPEGTVMFAPPFGGPSNYVFDPLIHAGIDLVGAAMHDRFARERKAGVTMRAGGTYSTWWNGGLRTTAYFHNQIGLLTETIGSPTPIDIPYVAGRRARSADLPDPITPQRWRFRRSIEYSLTANRAVLDIASRHRERLLFNIYRMGKNSIERGSRDFWTALPRRSPGRELDPRLRDARGYILPADQADFPTATRFVNALLKAGVAVHRATAPFSVDGRRYPAGSYVVKTAQAFRPHVLDMFEPQDYPDEVPYAGASPRPPYDTAGWTLAFQMGVTFDRVLDAFEGPFEAIAGVAAVPAGQVTRAAGAAGYLVSHHQNDAFVAVNRLLKAGEDVYWPLDRGPAAAGGADPSPGGGDMYIAAKPSTLPILRKAAAELGLTFTGVGAAPAGDALKLRPVRIGLADRPGGSVPSGWTRWMLERYEFPFDVVLPQRLDAEDLAETYDVLIFPDDTMPDLHGGPPADGARLLARLRRFVEEGGTLLAVGAATAVGAELGLPIENALVDGRKRPLPPELFYVPGSVLRVSVDNTTPPAYGFDGEVDVFFDNSPVFRLAPDAAARGSRAVAWFATGAPLRSGWASGQEYLRDTVAIVDAALGKGRVLLCGPRITFRAQSHGTFKFLFNGIYYGSATSARPNG